MYDVIGFVLTRLVAIFLASLYIFLILFISCLIPPNWPVIVGLFSTRKLLLLIAVRTVLPSDCNNVTLAHEVRLFIHSSCSGVLVDANEHCARNKISSATSVATWL